MAYAEDIYGPALASSVTETGYASPRSHQRSPEKKAWNDEFHAWAALRMSCTMHPFYQRDMKIAQQRFKDMPEKDFRRWKAKQVRDNAQAYLDALDAAETLAEQEGV